MLARNEHKKRILTDTSMLNALDKKHQKIVEQSRTYIKTVAEVLLFTAMQNISQRGHLETDAYTNKGNVLGIMDLIAKHSPLIDKKLIAVGNAKYTSNTIQNEILECLSDMVQEDLRSDSSFDEIWKDTLDMGKQCNVAVETVVKRPQKICSRLSGSIVESTVGQRRSKEGDMERFSSGIFYPILDCLSGEMERRFSKSNCSIMQGIQALNPKSRNFLDEETIFRFARIYEFDTDDIKHELHQVRRVIERKFQTGIELSSLLELTNFLEPFKEVSASCERSFSALKLIKTHLRTTITDDRLGNLGVLIQNVYEC
uniref:Uncharacterized protein n=1 Tax=Sinocyclocheilus rhinocerous TaxID=307959 RepID=A0A673GCT8_9TELE